ncbi:uncharacterized protein LOC117332621 [Pecten maximus]|uniref:uncharacterized protein LOC117332621 n=1 Tax=Pecten maximus TaxID=6579 RepID=UPI001457EC55|nr:uncharacterized protein LOC117332621 [Pecten maximus]
MKIVKHCGTRWLSLEKCVGRLLQQWPALQSYFESNAERDSPGRVKTCADALQSHTVHIYCLFLDYFLPVLNEFNTLFQTDVSLIGHLHTQMQRLMRRLLGKFVQVKEITAHTDLRNVKFLDQDKQLANNFLAIGLDTRTFISNHSDDLLPKDIETVFSSIRTFYERVTEKMLKKFPFDDKVLQQMKFLNPTERESVTQSEVGDLAERFLPNIARQLIEDEVLDFILSPSSSLPSHDPEKPESFWIEIGQQKDLTGKPFYRNLSQLALALCSMAHSNAASERSFSILRKIQTDWRGNLSNKTIHSLMSVKFNMHSDCFNYTPTNAVLQNAKKACAM